jgi:hypothetical protein
MVDVVELQILTGSVFKQLFVKYSCIEKNLRPSDLVLTLSCFCFINCQISREARVKVNDYPYEFQKPFITTNEGMPK